MVLVDADGAIAAAALRRTAMITDLMRNGVIFDRIRELILKKNPIEPQCCRYTLAMGGFLLNNIKFICLMKDSVYLYSFRPRLRIRLPQLSAACRWPTRFEVLK